MNKTLNVWWEDRLVGQLLIDEHGELEFVYGKDWLKWHGAHPISQSLPLKPEPFNRRDTRPFFAGLLPEADIKKGVARALQLSEQNDFGLLNALGGDVAGALTLLPADEALPKLEDTQASESLTDDALIALLDRIPQRPFLAGESGVRLSLAGAQQKLPVVLVGGRIALPAPGQPTTHILKPPIQTLAHSTENEAFAMQLAAAIDLSVAPAVPMRVKDRPYLLVTRYDRRLDRNGRAHRLHQEDFCQAMSITPEHKYAAEGGPTFKTSFALLRSSTTRPAIETLKLLDAALFNLIVGNADAHGKNYSLLYKDAQTTLAPLYDLMCTMAYPDVVSTLAMKFAQTSSLDEFRPKVWKSFAADIEISAAYTRKRVREIAALMLKHAPTVANSIAAQGFDRAALQSFSAVVVQRADTVCATL
jgi:serine/threonine-protein kinase HipA